MSQEEVQQQLASLQNQLMESNRRIDTVQTKVNYVMRHKRRATITQQELAAEPKAEQIFKSVGRMYIVTTPDDMNEELKEIQADCDKKLKMLEAQHKYLADDNVNIQKNLRDFVNQHAGGSA